MNLGSEYQWDVLMGSEEPSGLGSDYVRYFMLNDPAWNYTDFDYNIVQLADQIQPGNATAGDFAGMDLFRAKGGKLLR